MTQPSYYRSLEQMADTPEFRAFAREEFPAIRDHYGSSAVRYAARVSRRDFSIFPER